MSRWIARLVALAAGAALVHVLVVRLVPWAVMGLAIAGIERRAGVNTAVFAPRADETSRTIVRPSPDLLYGTCAFDVREHPLRIRAEVPRDTYWSLSMFAANTDNFFVVNDRQAGAGGTVDLVLARRGVPVQVPAGARLVEAPTGRGLVLTRTLIASPERLDELDRARRRLSCEELRAAR
ncbi:MAG: DUF1254 domain-containing protein [Thermodesulfobacteriota bacterium]